MISVDWKPAKNVNVLEKVSKFKMDDIIDELKRCLIADWPKSKFIIGVNEHEEVNIIFDIDTT